MKINATFVIPLLLILGSATAYGQFTAYANIYATVVAPVGIQTEMNAGYGEIVMTKDLLATSSSISKVVVSGTELPKEGDFTIASFTITDSRNSTYGITLPSSNLVLGTGSAESMTISDFTASNNSRYTAQGRINEVKIGAHLNFATKENTDLLKGGNAAFPVTLNYN